MERYAKVSGTFPKTEKQYKEERVKACEALYRKTGKSPEMTEWLDWPQKYYESEEYERLIEVANKIKEENDAVVIIGIGGSYLTPRMVIESAYGLFFNEVCEKYGGSKIYFAGCDMSTQKLYDISDLLTNEDWSIIYISKSGKTFEPAAQFRFFWEELCKKYQKEADERVYVITDESEKESTLKKISNENKWESFIVPDGIGGRYSGLTSVGLLPIEIAEINTSEILIGAIEAMEDCFENPNSFAAQYAEWRYSQYMEGRRIEFFANMDPYMTYFGEWWKQLFGESEGKDGKGIFPTSGVFPTDLHSLGQFLQEGTKGLIFETFLSRDAEYLVKIPDVGLNDNLSEYAETISYKDAENACLEGSIKAHEEGGNPCAVIHMGASGYDIGYLMQSMFVACAIYCYMLGVDPFNQPGVEKHKIETRKNISDLLK